MSSKFTNSHQHNRHRRKIHKHQDIQNIVEQYMQKLEQEM